MIKSGTGSLGSSSSFFSHDEWFEARDWLADEWCGSLGESCRSFARMFGYGDLDMPTGSL